MTELAHTQIQRIVGFVAWMSQRDSESPISYAAAARHLGVTEAVLLNDVEILIALTDQYKSWLASLSVAITAKGLNVASRGAYRRPFRLSRDEALALVVGLAGVAGGRALAGKLGASFALPEPAEVDRAWAVGPTTGITVAQALSVARQARDEGRKAELFYCGSDGEPSRRSVEIHQVVQGSGAWYLIAWCDQAQAARRFRADRIMEIRLTDAYFAPRPDLRRVKLPADLFQADELLQATVAFSGSIARWMREKYPAGRIQGDGRYVVQLPVADPRWLAREVLQYGAEAEVVGPPGLRDYVRQVLC
jgi:predicted DNA-binding transcriptional regulator YafY